jgi:PBP1b-binding outer membrane lipoprotein LpoB
MNKLKKIIVALVVALLLAGCATRDSVVNRLSMGADRLLEDSMIISCEGATVASVFRYMEKKEIDPSAYAEVCDWPDYITRRLSREEN